MTQFFLTVCFGAYDSRNQMSLLDLAGLNYPIHPSKQDKDRLAAEVAKKSKIFSSYTNILPVNSKY